ncbi:hypothetical protein ACHAXH_003191 [Discostella pseudostelligera]
MQQQQHQQQQQQQQQQQEAINTEPPLPKWTTIGGTKHRRRVRYAATTATAGTPSPHGLPHHRSSSNNYEESDDASDHVPRGLVATPMNLEACQPMSPGARLIHKIRHEDSNIGGDGGDNEGGETQMYRLMATRGTRDVGRCGRTIRFLYACIKCGALTESSIEQSTHMGSMANPSRWLTDFFFWLFRKGWTTVIFLSIVWYYALVLFFAGLIVWSSKLDSDCIREGDTELGEGGHRLLFMDAFSLSWNTFSTVGYGSSYPALSTQHDDAGDEKCVFIIFITSMEALAGVVYAGFTGAILFSKITRITQEADVQFSDSLTVRFGVGVEEKLVDDDEGTTPRLDDKMNKMSPMQRFRYLASSVSKPSPFPVITFRLANTLHNVSGGEIISANLNAAVLTESRRYEHQISNDLANQIQMDRMRRATTSSLHMRSSFRSVGRMTDFSSRSASKIVPRQIFTKLNLEKHEHPLFKRIWRINHVINSNSPLLTDEAKQAITANNGDWPKEWNTHNAVRNAIRFNELVVSFTGVSNLTGAPVYKQKVYNFDDVAVGYEFVHTLYRGGRDGSLKVDLNLINDVVEQKGGGGEPLNVTAR